MLLGKEPTEYNVDIIYLYFLTNSINMACNFSNPKGALFATIY